MNNLMIFSAKYLYLFEIILIIVYFFKLPKDKKKLMCVISVIYLPITYIVSKLASLLYFNPRPFVVNNFIPLISHSSDNGFPSDHVLLTGAISSILFVYNKKIGTVAWILTFIIGFSRVFVGVHHWADIIGSIIITILVMWFTQKIILPRLSKTKLYNQYIKNIKI